MRLYNINSIPCLDCQKFSMHSNTSKQCPGIVLTCTAQQILQGRKPNLQPNGAFDHISKRLHSELTISNFPRSHNYIYILGYNLHRTFLTRANCLQHYQCLLQCCHELSMKMWPLLHALGKINSALPIEMKKIEFQFTYSHPVHEILSYPPTCTEPKHLLPAGLGGASSPLTRKHPAITSRMISHARGKPKGLAKGSHTQRTHTYTLFKILSLFPPCTSKCQCADCRIWVACSVVHPTAFTKWPTMICLRKTSVLASITERSRLSLTNYFSLFLQRSDAFESTTMRKRSVTSFSVLVNKVWPLTWPN